MAGVGVDIDISGYMFSGNAGTLLKVGPCTQETNLAQAVCLLALFFCKQNGVKIGSNKYAFPGQTKSDVVDYFQDYVQTIRGDPLQTIDEVLQSGNENAAAVLFNIAARRSLGGKADTFFITEDVILWIDNIASVFNATSSIPPGVSQLEWETATTAIDLSLNMGHIVCGEFAAASECDQGYSDAVAAGAPSSRQAQQRNHAAIVNYVEVAPLAFSQIALQILYAIGKTGVNFCAFSNIPCTDDPVGIAPIF